MFYWHYHKVDATDILGGSCYVVMLYLFVSLSMQYQLGKYQVHFYFQLAYFEIYNLIKIYLCLFNRIFGYGTKNWCLLGVIFFVISMGGAIAVHVASRQKLASLAALVVIDVVEGLLQSSHLSHFSLYFHFYEFYEFLLLISHFLLHSYLVKTSVLFMAVKS